MTELGNRDPQGLKEIIRLLESDHDATISMIARLAGIRDALVGLAFSATGVLVGVAFANRSWQLAAAGIPLVGVLAFIEARNRFLHLVLQNRVSRLERRLQAYVDSLIEQGRPLEQEAIARLQKELDDFEFGVGRSLRYPPPMKALKVALGIPTFYLYLVLVGVLIASTAVLI